MEQGTVCPTCNCEVGMRCVGGIGGDVLHDDGKGNVSVRQKCLYQCVQCRIVVIE